jgi:hypothetical protein
VEIAQPKPHQRPEPPFAPAPDNSPLNDMPKPRDAYPSMRCRHGWTPPITWLSTARLYDDDELRRLIKLVERKRTVWKAANAQ